MSIDKLPLLFGLYVAPKAEIGSVLYCKYRSRSIRITGLSSTPIPCPVGGDS